MGQVCTIRRPGREPPAPPPAPAPVTGNVVLERAERDALLAVQGVAQQFARIASGQSAPASQVARIGSLAIAMVDALSALAAAHEAANERRGL